MNQVSKRVLIIDGMNLVHRARVAMSGHGNGLTYAALRSIRALVNLFDPNVAYFVLEGHPKRRIQLSEGTYKAQREKSDEAFWDQVKQLVEVVSNYLPIKVIRHPDFEADDVIAHLATGVHRDDFCTVVSTDSDFTQLVTEATKDRFSLYSPIKKVFVQPTPYDYVLWKSLRGDGADNIDGVPGIGDKRATNFAMNPVELRLFFNKNPAAKKIVEHNISMIKFEDMRPHWDGVTVSSSTRDNTAFREKLQSLDMNSITNDKNWPKWIGSFNQLWLSFNLKNAA
jgi:hypothetical protein